MLFLIWHEIMATFIIIVVLCPLLQRQLISSLIIPIMDVDRWGMGGTRPPHFSAWW